MRRLEAWIKIERPELEVAMPLIRLRRGSRAAMLSASL
jgi:hypothetical protein